MEIAPHHLPPLPMTDQRSAVSDAAIRRDHLPGQAGTGALPGSAGVAAGPSAADRVLKPYGVAMLPETQRQGDQGPFRQSPQPSEISRAAPQTLAQAQARPESAHAPERTGQSAALVDRYAHGLDQQDAKQAAHVPMSPKAALPAPG